MGNKIENWANGQLISVSDTRTLDDAINEAIERIEIGYQSALQSGIQPQGCDYILGATDDDAAKFSRLMTLLREAEELAADKDAFKQSPVTIADKDGQPHTITVSEVRAILVSYGIALQTLWGTKATLTATAKGAASIQEADAINW